MRLARIMHLSSYIALFNLLIWFAVSLYIGGDAPSGKVLDGRYFVSSHARLTEVSRSVYVFSLWHSYVAWGGLLAYVVAGIFWKGRAFWRDTK